MKYNGWSNYVTWKMNLEFIDEQLNHIYEVAPLTKDPAEMAEFLQCMWEEYIEHLQSQRSIPHPHRPERDDWWLLFSFVDCYVEDVDWGEIADHVIEDRP